jgi:hypothetical protein
MAVEIGPLFNTHGKYVPYTEPNGLCWISWEISGRAMLKFSGTPYILRHRKTPSPFAGSSWFAEFVLALILSGGDDRNRTRMQFFLKYVNNIFIPCFNELRESEQINACEAIRLTDNCSPHMSNNVIAVLTNAPVRVITFAPYMTHVFQMLDVVLFSALRKRASRLEM